MWGPLPAASPGPCCGDWAATPARTGPGWGATLQSKAFLASRPSLPSLRPALGPWPDTRPAPGHPWARAAAAHTRTVRICCACPQPLASRDRKDDGPTGPSVKRSPGGKNAVVGAQAWTSVFSGDAGCPGEQAMDASHCAVTRSLSGSLTEPEVSGRGQGHVQGGWVDGQDQLRGRAPGTKPGLASAPQHPGTGGHSWEGVQCGPNDNVISQSQCWRRRRRQDQPGSRLVLLRLNHSQDGDWLSVSLGTSPSTPAAASCPGDTDRAGWSMGVCRQAADYDSPVQVGTGEAQHEGLGRQPAVQVGSRGCCARHGLLAATSCPRVARHRVCLCSTPAWTEGGQSHASLRPKHRQENHIKKITSLQK